LNETLIHWSRLPRGIVRGSPPRLLPFRPNKRFQGKGSTATRRNRELWPRAVAGRRRRSRPRQRQLILLFRAAVAIAARAPRPSGALSPTKRSLPRCRVLQTAAAATATARCFCTTSPPMPFLRCFLSPSMIATNFSNHADHQKREDEFVERKYPIQSGLEAGVAAHCTGCEESAETTLHLGVGTRGAEEVLHDMRQLRM
jgi:hypothetical protein